VFTAQQILVDQIVTAPAFYPMLLTVLFPVSSAYLITSIRAFSPVFAGYGGAARSWTDYCWDSPSMR
jgi:hypothetical protein